MNLKKFFPIKKESIDDFIAHVKSEESNYITIQPHASIRGKARMEPEGSMGSINHFVRYKSTTESGRPIIFDEVYSSYIGSEIMFHMFKNRYDGIGLEQAREGLQKLTKELPEVEISDVTGKISPNDL